MPSVSPKPKSHKLPTPARKGGCRPDCIAAQPEQHALKDVSP